MKRNKIISDSESDLEDDTKTKKFTFDSMPTPKAGPSEIIKREQKPTPIYDYLNRQKTTYSSKHKCLFDYYQISNEFRQEILKKQPFVLLTVMNESITAPRRTRSSSIASSFVSTSSSSATASSLSSSAVTTKNNNIVNEVKPNNLEVKEAKIPDEKPTKLTKPLENALSDSEDVEIVSISGNFAKRKGSDARPSEVTATSSGSSKRSSSPLSDASTVKLAQQKITSSYCRLCGEDRPGMSCITEEAMSGLFLEILYQHMNVNVFEDENLPFHVCFSCCTQVNTFRAFYSKSLVAHEKLTLIKKGAESSGVPTPWLKANQASLAKKTVLYNYYRDYYKQKIKLKARLQKMGVDKLNTFDDDIEFIGEGELLATVSSEAPTKTDPTKVASDEIDPEKKATNKTDPVTKSSEKLGTLISSPKHTPEQPPVEQTPPPKPKSVIRVKSISRLRRKQKRNKTSPPHSGRSTSDSDSAPPRQSPRKTPSVSTLSNNTHTNRTWAIAPNITSTQNSNIDRLSVSPHVMPQMPQHTININVPVFAGNHMANSNMHPLNINNSMMPYQNIQNISQIGSNNTNPPSTPLPMGYMYPNAQPAQPRNYPNQTMYGTPMGEMGAIDPSGNAGNVIQSATRAQIDALATSVFGINQPHANSQATNTNTTNATVNCRPESSHASSATYHIPRAHAEITRVTNACHVPRQSENVAKNPTYTNSIASSNVSANSRVNNTPITPIYQSAHASNPIVINDDDTDALIITNIMSEVSEARTQMQTANPVTATSATNAHVQPRKGPQDMRPLSSQELQRYDLNAFLNTNESVNVTNIQTPVRHQSNGVQPLLAPGQTSVSNTVTNPPTFMPDKPKARSRAPVSQMRERPRENVDNVVLVSNQDVSAFSPINRAFVTSNMSSTSSNSNVMAPVSQLRANPHDNVHSVNSAYNNAATPITLPMSNMGVVSHAVTTPAPSRFSPNVPTTLSNNMSVVSNAVITPAPTRFTPNVPITSPNSQVPYVANTLMRLANMRESVLRGLNKVASPTNTLTNSAMAPNSAMNLLQSSLATKMGFPADKLGAPITKPVNDLRENPSDTVNSACVASNNSNLPVTTANLGAAINSTVNSVPNARFRLTEPKNSNRTPIMTQAVANKIATLASPPTTTTPGASGSDACASTSATKHVVAPFNFATKFKPRILSTTTATNQDNASASKDVTSHKTREWITGQEFATKLLVNLVQFETTDADRDNSVYVFVVMLMDPKRYILTMNPNSVQGNMHHAHQVGLFPRNHVEAFKDSAKFRTCVQKIIWFKKLSIVHNIQQFYRFNPDYILKKARHLLRRNQVTEWTMRVVNPDDDEVSNNDDANNNDTDNGSAPNTDNSSVTNTDNGSATNTDNGDDTTDVDDATKTNGNDDIITIMTDDDDTDNTNTNPGDERPSTKNPTQLNGAERSMDPERAQVPHAVNSGNLIDDLEEFIQVYGVKGQETAQLSNGIGTNGVISDKHNPVSDSSTVNAGNGVGNEVWFDVDAASLLEESEMLLGE